MLFKLFKMSIGLLSAHYTVIIASYLFFWFVEYFSGVVSPVFSKKFSTLPLIVKINWRTKVVSTVHAIFACICGYKVLNLKSLDASNIFGYDPFAGNVYGVVCGYFLYDVICCIKYFKLFGIGFLIHGVACLIVYLGSFRPFLMYHGGYFLLYESTTPFLNIHWFLHKLGKSGSKEQKINGVILAVTFLVVRIIFGLYWSIIVIRSIAMNFENIPIEFQFIYLTSNVVLNMLNIYWFTLIMNSIFKTFDMKVHFSFSNK
ncbi:DUF887 family protein [Rozella allomycis CSF55]|uniref:DUF887 family protein n=1 Tax=Rozella allomycis (strain CSF55) TaxID=988480 RepID=A0A4V1J076_ROZAC|nr:DUF887 family protein [Rozella allomycis CSF55]